MSGFNNRPNLGRQLANNLASNFSGIISTRPTAKYASGARTILKINGKIVGFAFSVSWRIRTDFLEINSIDNIEAEELAPQRISVEGSISALHIPGISAATEQWQGTVKSFLFNKYVTIEVRDSQTDEILFYTAKAVITSRQEDIRVDDLANVSLTFKAIGWRDEMQPKYPNGHNDVAPSSGLEPGLQLPSGDFSKLPTNIA
jgi:hypothetical protein